MNRPGDVQGTSRMAFVIAAMLGLLLPQGSTTHAAEPAAGIDITACSVYSDRDKSLRQDCVDEARKLCAGQYFCELPIGLNLTGGRDLDGNENTWELVRVDYSCAGKPHINGPHHQNDHATMTLSCPH